MPDQRITIKVTQEITHDNGSPPWRVGAKIHTTHDELKQRGVPSTHYTVVTPAPAGNAPAPKNAAPDTPPKK